MSFCYTYLYGSVYPHLLFGDVIITEGWFCVERLSAIVPMPCPVLPLKLIILEVALYGSRLAQRRRRPVEWLDPSFFNTNHVQNPLNLGNPLKWKWIMSLPRETTATHPYLLSVSRKLPRHLAKAVVELRDALGWGRAIGWWPRSRVSISRRVPPGSISSFFVSPV